MKGFLPGADRDAAPLPEVDGIEVTTASPRYLLAMKLLAMRFGEDDDDIQVLLRQTGIPTRTMRSPCWFGCIRIGSHR